MQRSHARMAKYHGPAPATHRRTTAPEEAVLQRSCYSSLFDFPFAASRASQRSGSSLKAAAQPEQHTGYDFPWYSTFIVPRPPEMMHLGPGLSLSATANDVPSRCWRMLASRAG